MARALRVKHKLKIRQPLPALILVTRNEAERDRLRKVADILMEELNVVEVRFADNEDDLVDISAKANFKALGPRLGAVVKKVADAIDVPLIVWGTANHDKDTEVLRQVAEVCQGKNLIIGPLEEGDHKKIGAAAIGYHHTVIASTPIDINLAKQLNILLGNLGVSDDLIIVDPTVSCIGYGIEYCYSVMERMRMAGLTQQDEKLQFPLICNISKEAWKTKEVHIPTAEDPKMGDAKKRGILLEAMSAVVLLLAGGDVMIMRHPEAIKLVREMITELSAAS